MEEWTPTDAEKKGREWIQAGRFPEAENIFESLLEVRQRDPELWHMLGFLASWDRRFELAEIRLREAVRLRPKYPEALNTLGSLLEARGRPEEALKVLDAALDLRPEFLEALYNKARALQSLGRFEEAEPYYSKVLERKPEAVDALNNLGLVYQELGRPDRALSCFRAAVQFSAQDTPQRRGPSFTLQNAEPQQGTTACPRLHSNLLMALNYVDDYSPEEIKKEHLTWAGTHADPWVLLQKPFLDHPCHARIRIGYVTADFRNHSVAFFMEGILKDHNREAFEISAYYSHPFEDEVSQRFKGYVDHWIPCAGLDDAELAELIRRDGIDILVDLSGHTQGNRLPVFARRPAPIQVSWLGYQNTTGLSTMDFRLTDRFADPEGETEHLYTETLVRLPIRQCFVPPVSAPEVSPLPALQKGCITFGSMNAFRKSTATCLDLWAQVLRTLPETRLMVLNAGSHEVQQSLRTAFSSRGVDPDRLDLRGKVSFPDFLALHEEVDIAFDPYPYGGGTTTCLGLWMGVPVVTLQGRSIASRSGARLLAPMGMGDWIAQNLDSYVRIAVEKARDIEALSRLRNELRGRMTASALTDHKALTLALETAFRSMMGNWYRTHPGPA